MQKIVLLVDDNSSVRALLARQLARPGRTVLEAANGLEALRLVEDIPLLDLIITDVVMPEMDGIRLVDHLRAAQKARRVLFISGACGADVLDNRLQPGEIQFLPKPISLTRFDSFVKDLLS